MPLVPADDPAVYGTTALDMRITLRQAHLNPHNVPFIFDLNQAGIHTTPFGEFLTAVGKAVEKILRRNFLIGEYANISDDQALWSMINNIGLEGLPAWKTKDKIHSVDDFKATADEISQLHKLFTPLDLVRAIDHFVYVSHLRENTKYVQEVISAWDKFRKAAVGHPLFEPLLAKGTFMSDVANNGLQVVIENFITKHITRDDIKLVLGLHEQAARSHGIEPRTAKILSILNQYRGWMKPIIINYRKLSADVVRERRQQFEQSDINDDSTRAHFLHSLNDADTLMAYYKLGLSLLKIRSIKENLNFGQSSNKRGPNPNAITVEHMTPLVSGETWRDNLALSTAKANADMNRLVELQTDFLKRDEVERGPGGSVVAWKRQGDTIAVIAMRPPYITIGEGKKMPSFMRHDGWNL